MQVYQYASRDTQGARSYQEDMAAVLVERDPTRGAVGSGVPPARRLVAVLADGMGGHAGGDIASRTVCESFLDVYDRTHMDMPTSECLLNALQQCNEAVAERIATNPMLRGMGSTLVGVVFGPDGAEWISVGDSPLYLYRHGEIALLNADHSLAPELDQLAAAGLMTVEAAQADSRRHMLRSAVCGDDIALVDQSQRPTPLRAGDYVILASDGLQTLATDEIARLVEAYAGAGPDAVASALIRAVEALRMPHQDNATVVVVRPVLE